MPLEVVVKVGGSLFDLPDFGRRLRSWLDALPQPRVLLVPGGGTAAELVRTADALDHLGEEQCHWLALRALTFTAHLLAARLPGGLVVADVADCTNSWGDKQTPILDLHTFALADEARPDHLPHTWAATSDSLAARVALVAGIGDLVLLKSRDLPIPDDWAEAARQGVVDAAFPELLAKANAKLRVKAINFRSLPFSLPAPILQRRWT